MASDEIPVRDYVDRLIREVDKRHADLREADKEAVDAALAAADKAVEVAKVANDEHLALHNGVLEEMKKDRSLFPTKDVLDELRQQIERDRRQDDTRMKRMESFQSKLLGGMMVLGAIGVGNLVRVLVG